MGRPPRLTDLEMVWLTVVQALLGFTSEMRWLRFVRARLRLLFQYAPQQSASPVVKNAIRILTADTDFYGCCWWRLTGARISRCGRWRCCSASRVRSRPHPRSPRTPAGHLAGPPAAQTHRRHRRRHPRAHPRPHQRRVQHEQPAPDQPAGRYQRQQPPPSWRSRLPLPGSRNDCRGPSTRRARARVDHALPRLKNRDCRRSMARIGQPAPQTRQPLGLAA